MTSRVEVTLREAARQADALHEQSRRMLVESIRAGAAAGLTQRQIAEAVGRSQPEVSRLLRFRGRTPLGRAVEASRRAILIELTSAGARSPRVFGSVARGDDGPGSDLDLLVDFVRAPSLLELAQLERRLEAIVGTSVDVVGAAGLRSHLAARALAEAVPL